MDDIAAVATRALEILDRDGWCKYFLQTPGGCSTTQHCIGGAWNLAASSDSCSWNAEYTEHYAKIMELICEQYPEYAAFRPRHPDYFSCIYLIADWNNHEDITEADVRVILEKLAAGDPGEF